MLRNQVVTDEDPQVRSSHQPPSGSFNRSQYRNEVGNHTSPQPTDDNLVPPWQPEGSETHQIKIRYFRPAAWVLVVSGGIFCGLSYLEAKKQLREESSNRWLSVPRRTIPSRGPTTPLSVATTGWAGLNDASKLSTALIGVNAAVHASSFLFKGPWLLAWHIPARNVNYTHFTSMFVHGGALHLGFNMYALSQFLPVACKTPLFEGNSNHMLAFYLSTGLLSGLADHFSLLLPGSRNSGSSRMWHRAGGASGALFGVLSVFCMQYPTAGLGIVFLPFSIEAQYFLPAVMLFDFVGMIRGYSFLRLGHGAHLGGALVGVAYSQLDGKKNLWDPLVRSWKQRLQ